MRSLVFASLALGIGAASSFAACGGSSFDSSADGGTGASQTGSGGASAGGADHDGSAGDESTGGASSGGDGGTAGSGAGGALSAGGRGGKGTGGKGTGGRGAGGASAGGTNAGGTNAGGAGGSATGGGGNGASCASNADCGPDGVCGFPESAACAAKGTCFPAPGATCAAYSAGCACDGTVINIVCTGLPSGYVSKPLAHTGACTMTDTTFACGTGTACSTATNYCKVAEGGVCCPPPTYSCQSIPAACVGNPTCACIQAAVGAQQCSESPTGGVTVTFQYP